MKHLENESQYFMDAKIKNPSFKIAAVNLLNLNFYLLFKSARLLAGCMYIYMMMMSVFVLHYDTYSVHTTFESETRRDSDSYV